jgi:N utilization substance protein B
VKVRRRARVIALQTLFEIDIVDHNPDQVLQEHFRARTLPQESRIFIRELVLGVRGQTDRLDMVIHRLAPEWPVDLMGFIDRNILRMAIFEIAMRADAPVKVVVNEAVELAKLFGSESSRRFVNGVLGTLISHMETDGGKLDQTLEKLASPELPQKGNSV